MGDTPQCESLGDLVIWEIAFSYRNRIIDIRDEIYDHGRISVKGTISVRKWFVKLTTGMAPSTAVRK